MISISNYQNSILLELEKRQYLQYGPDKGLAGHVDLTVLSIFKKAVTFDHNLTH